MFVVLSIIHWGNYLHSNRWVLKTLYQFIWKLRLNGKIPWKMQITDTQGEINNLNNFKSIKGIEFVV